MFKVLLREESFARAIRISTLPTRLSSLASGVSMFDMMTIELVSFGHGKRKNLDEWEVSIKKIYDTATGVGGVK